MEAPNSLFDFTFDPVWSDQMKHWMEQFEREHKPKGKDFQYTPDEVRKLWKESGRIIYTNTVDDMDAFDGEKFSKDLENASLRICNYPEGTVDDIDAFDGSRRHFYNRDEPGKTMAHRDIPSWYRDQEEIVKRRQSGKTMAHRDASWFKHIPYPELVSLPGKSIIEQISQSKFVCTACGAESNADINASKEILKRGKGIAIKRQREALACA